MKEPLILKSQPSTGIAQLQLNRPDAMNALTTELLCTLAQELDQIAMNDTIQVVIITGNEKAFAAGADVSELQLMPSGQYPEDERQQAWDKLRSFRKPLIASVHGFCLGGGCELMLHTDIIIAASNARFGQPEINLGIMPGAGGTQFLPRRIGKAAAMYLNLTGNLISAKTAMSYGLISEIAEPEICLSRAQQIAEQIAQKSTVAAQAIKRSVLNAYQTNEQQGLDMERQQFIDLATSADGIEGVSAFLNKRQPNFPSKHKK